MDGQVPSGVSAGTKLRSFGRATTALKCLAISQAPSLKKKKAFLFMCVRVCGHTCEVKGQLVEIHFLLSLCEFLGVLVRFFGFCFYFCQCDTA